MLNFSPVNEDCDWNAVTRERSEAAKRDTWTFN